MKMEAKQGRNRGLSQPPMPLERGDSFSDSKGISLSHSLAQITNFMSTSFPHRNKKDANKSTPSPEVSTLKEEFERKIAAVVFCLEEKAEENIDLSYKLKALQETSKQREVEKDRSIEDLLKALKIKEEECHQWEKKADNDEVLNELNRRIQTLTHCLNDMAEENLKLRTTVNANSNGKQVGYFEGHYPTIDHEPHESPPNSSSSPLSFLRKIKGRSKEYGDADGARPRAGSPFSAHSSSFSMEPDHSPSSASFLSSLTASSSILSVSKSSSSQPSSSSTSASSHSTSAPPTAAHLKVPSTSTAATNTSPVPTPAPAPPVQVVNLPSAVADMKSEIIAEELLKDGEWLRKFSDSYLVPAPPLQVLGLLSDIIKQDKQRSEASLKLAMDERITALESELQTKDSSLSTLTGTLAKETDRTGSLAESVAEYERKMKDLEGRMWDNLNKEAQRRTEAESKAKRLKKKVDELQFLLDELKDDGSDEDEDDEDEAEEETQREKEKEEKEEENVPSSSSSSSSSSSEEEENIEESKKDEADA